MADVQPKEVRRLLADLRERGFSPVARGVPGGEWEVAIEGEHVRATAGYVFRNGKTRQVPGTLTIDGEPRPLARDYEDLRCIWDEHENPAPAAAPVPAVLLEITGPGDQPVPYVVRSTAENVRLGVERAGSEFEVRVGTSGSHWVIGIDLPGGDGLRLVFTKYRFHGWELDRDQRVQVIAGGQDRSAEAEGDIGKALSLLTRTSPPKPGDPPPGTSAVRQQAGTRDQGVETRRRVVIRELGRGLSSGVQSPRTRGTGGRPCRGGLAALQRQLPGHRHRRRAAGQVQQPARPPAGRLQLVPPGPVGLQRGPERHRGAGQQPAGVHRDAAGQVHRRDHRDHAPGLAGQLPLAPQRGNAARLQLGVAGRIGRGAGADDSVQRLSRSSRRARRVQGHDDDGAGECVTAVPAAGTWPSPAPFSPSPPLAGRRDSGGGGGAMPSTTANTAVSLSTGPVSGSMSTARSLVISPVRTSARTSGGWRRSCAQDSSITAA